MRWRRARAGSVRLRSSELIELLRDTVQAQALESACREARVEIARARAAELAFGYGWSVDAVVADLPLREDGSLHEEAYLGLCEARMWAERDQLLAELIRGGS